MRVLLVALLVAGCGSDLDGALAAMDFQAKPLALDANHVYWYEYDGQLRRVPKTGGEVQTVSHGPEGQALAIRAQGDEVYWSVEGHLFVAKQSGGASKQFYHPATDFDVNDDTVFFSDRTTIFALSRQTGQAVPILEAPNSYHVRTWKDRLYWFDWHYLDLGVFADDAGLWTANLDGSNAHQLTKQPNDWSELLLSRESGVYFISDRALWRATGDELAKVVELPYWNGDLAADTDSVYYIQSSGFEGYDRIWRQPLDGGAPVLLYQGSEELKYLAADSTGVFYASDGFYRRPHSNESSTTGWFTEVRPRIRFISR